MCRGRGPQRVRALVRALWRMRGIRSVRSPLVVCAAFAAPNSVPLFVHDQSAICASADITYRVPTDSTRSRLLRYCTDRLGVASIRSTSYPPARIVPAPAEARVCSCLGYYCTSTTPSVLAVRTVSITHPIIARLPDTESSHIRM